MGQLINPEGRVNLFSTRGAPLPTEPLIRLMSFAGISAVMGVWEFWLPGDLRRSAGGSDGLVISASL